MQPWEKILKYESSNIVSGPKITINKTAKHKIWSIDISTGYFNGNTLKNTFDYINVKISEYHQYISSLAIPTFWLDV